MSDSAENRRYSAFLSYSQGDTPFVRKLHRWLETYRLPHRLAKGPGGRRLKPLFRDSDELAAAADLTAAVREALADADFLVVICSPRSAQSKWVGREIELFRHLHGGKRILTALIEGNQETSFHPALLRRPHGRATEPLAADFRPGKGGHRMAFLKLMAPLAGVGLDELIHRDGQRRMRQVMAGSGAAVAATAVVAVLGVTTINARSEAAAQRARGAGLGAYVAADLHEGLRSAGRLDLRMAVDRAALDYYRGQDLSRLPAETLAQRAKVLQAAGEDNEKHGDLRTAQTQFEEARRTTAALLAANPNDQQRIFDQAQSEYWVGFIHWRNGDGATAKARFETYAQLADRLIKIDPTNDAWLMETAYAANNLGMLALRQAGRPAEAETQFRNALRTRQVIAQHKPGDLKLQRDIANALGWLADSQRVKGDLRAAAATREIQRKTLADLLEKTPSDVRVQSAMLGHDLAVARIEAANGDYRRAATHLDAGRNEALTLVRSDPTNKDLAKQLRMFELFQVRTWLAMPQQSRPPLQKIAATLDDCGPAKALADDEIGDFCAILLSRVREAAGDQAGARSALAAAQQDLGNRRDVLTAHWGLNLKEEAGAIQLAAVGGEAK